MAYRGKLAPVLSDMSGSDDSVIYLPTPLKGQRKEDFKIKTKTYTNIYGKRIVGETRYRFEGKYEFGEVDVNVLARVTALCDNSTIIKFMPHSDFAFINFMCVNKEISIPPLQGNITRDALKMTVEGVDFIDHIPTADNMYGAFMLDKIANYNQGETQ